MILSVNTIKHLSFNIHARKKKKKKKLLNGFIAERGRIYWRKKLYKSVNEKKKNTRKQINIHWMENLIIT